jgi:hypothetical protein
MVTRKLGSTKQEYKPERKLTTPNFHAATHSERSLTVRRQTRSFLRKNLKQIQYRYFTPMNSMTIVSLIAVLAAVCLVKRSATSIWLTWLGLFVILLVLNINTVAQTMYQLDPDTVQTWLHDETGAGSLAFLLGAAVGDLVKGIIYSSVYWLGILFRWLLFWQAQKREPISNR